MLYSIAKDGANIDVDPAFRINSQGDAEVRTLQKRLTKCYAQHVVDLWSQQRGLLFRIADIGIANEMVHKSPAHWFPKPVDQLDAQGNDVNVNGRFLLDLSNISNPEIQVNGGTAKELAGARYGKFHLVSATDVFIGIMIHVVTQQLLWKDIFMWKLDIKGAFSRFNFNKDSALLLGVIVAAGILFIFTHGMFGWTGCPNVFNVIASAILRLIRRECKGVIFLYVDDFMGFGTLLQCAHDQALSVDRCKEALGTDAIANNKTVLPTRKAVILGWETTIHDDGVWIRPSTKGINKILFVFFCFDDTKGQPYSLWVVLAAIAERYSNGILGARCLVAGLNKMVGASLRRPRSKTTATSEARFEIEMWRVMGLLLWSNPTSLSISIEMFTHRYDITKSQANRSVYTITDASGWRICVALYDAETKVLIAWSSYLFPFQLIPELYQNNREFWE